MRPLFSRVDIPELKKHHEQQAKETVDRLPARMFDKHDADTASRVVATFTLELPEIDELKARFKALAPLTPRIGVTREEKGRYNASHCPCLAR